MSSEVVSTLKWPSRIRKMTLKLAGLGHALRQFQLPHQLKLNICKYSAEYLDPNKKHACFWINVSEISLVLCTVDILQIYMYDGWGDGWNGHAQHVWDKAYIEKIYPNQKKLYMPSMLQGEPGEDMGSYVSFDFGWFALLASEVGDTETVQTMVDYADKHFQPTWKDGGYYYPTTPDYQYNFNRDEKGFIKNVGPVTGNVLIGFTSINPKDGLWQIYNKPFNKSHFLNPYITQVEYLEANVTQAIYDTKKEALILTLGPGPVKSETTSFTVRQLDPLITYKLIIDGQVQGEINASKGIALPNINWQSDGSLQITIVLDKMRSFVLKANSIDTNTVAHETVQTKLTLLNR